MKMHRLDLDVCVAHMINAYRHLERGERQNNKKEKYYYWPISQYILWILLGTKNILLYTEVIQSKRLLNNFTST